MYLVFSRPRMDLNDYIHIKESTDDKVHIRSCFNEIRIPLVMTLENLKYALHGDSELFSDL